MICPSCNKDTAPQMYCEHCGAKMDLTYNEVRNRMTSAIRMEKKAETEQFFGWLLKVTIICLIISSIFRSLWQNPPVLEASPGFIPQIEIPEEMKSIYKPIIIKK